MCRRGTFVGVRRARWFSAVGEEMGGGAMPVGGGAMGQGPCRLLDVGTGDMGSGPTGVSGHCPLGSTPSPQPSADELLGQQGGANRLSASVGKEGRVHVRACARVCVVCVVCVLVWPPRHPCPPRRPTSTLGHSRTTQVRWVEAWAWPCRARARTRVNTHAAHISVDSSMRPPFVLWTCCFVVVTSFYEPPLGLSGCPPKGPVCAIVCCVLRCGFT